MKLNGCAKFQTPAIAVAFANACRCAGYTADVQPEFMGCTVVKWYRLYSAA